MKEDNFTFDINSIINTYQDMVTRICLLNLKNEEDAKDCFQNVFLKLMNTDTSFHDESHLKHWLIRVTINECKNYHRFLNKSVQLAEIVIPYVDRKEFTLLPEVLKLPKKYKNTLYLYYYEGYKITEIAKILNCNENTVKSYLKRGRELLRKRLGDCYE